MIWGSFSILQVPHDSDVMLQILLFAGTSSNWNLNVGYVSSFHILNVKKPTSRGISAVVKNSTNSIINNFEATQRLHAGDLIFAYLVGLIEGFSVTKGGNYVKYEFGIQLHIRDVQLLYKIKELLGVGTIHFSSNRDMVMYRVRNKISFNIYCTANF